MDMSEKDLEAFKKEVVQEARDGVEADMMLSRNQEKLERENRQWYRFISTVTVISLVLVTGFWAWMAWLAVSAFI
jgi:hypothetical protein